MDNKRILFATGEDTISVMAIDSQKKEVIEGVKSFYVRYSMERNAIIFIDKENQAISVYNLGTQRKNVIVNRAKLSAKSDPR